VRSQITIRDETAGDLEAIYSVNEQAFETNAEAELVDLLRMRGKAVISLVAEVGGEIVGHILFSPVSIEPPVTNWKALGLAPVGVVPGYQRQGIGKALVKVGLERSKQLGIALVVVLGHPSYYPKFGFKKASEYELANEYQADEAFMAIELKPGVLNDYKGLVKYAPEFNELRF
jgi:putative acetyltransferase